MGTDKDDKSKKSKHEFAQKETKKDKEIQKERMVKQKQSDKKEGS